jgi:hypothetical protein
MAASKTNAIGARNPREDSRLHKSAAPEARGSRAAGDQERASDSGTVLTAEQQRALIRNEFVQEALPRVPDIPGYHLCWLSTTNSYDPIHKRMRLGYEPVRMDEMPGFESMKMKSGEFEGCISCNEMLLFKIPTERYLAIMEEFHHNMPLEEESALRQQLVREQDVDSKGKKLGQITEDSDGFDDLAVQRRGSFVV